VIDLLAVGHVARDEFPGAPWRLGGTALYAAVAAARLGRRSALVTRVGPGERDALEQRCHDEGIELHALSSVVTTTFAFRYDDEGHRHLTLRARAKGISREDVAGRLRVPRAVVYASIAHELSPGLLGAITAPASVLVAQGYLRGWEADGTVVPREWTESRTMLAAVGAAVVSEDDLGGDLRLAEAWSATTPVVVTLAERGARIFERGAARDIPGFRAGQVVDQTGAGDAFAAGLALALAEEKSLDDAARYANAVASFAVEGLGTEGLGDARRVEARLAGG
jgi:sugar/nucleoside kinase (ribokinase family)